MQVFIDGVNKTLTPYQFKLLYLISRFPGRIFSRENIFDNLKGNTLESFDRSIDVHISRIRAAIEDDPKKPKRILTLRGAGYFFASHQD